MKSYCLHSGGKYNSCDSWWGNESQYSRLYLFYKTKLEIIHANTYISKTTLAMLVFICCSCFYFPYNFQPSNYIYIIPIQERSKVVGRNWLFEGFKSKAAYLNCEITLFSTKDLYLTSRQFHKLIQ